MGFWRDAVQSYRRTKTAWTLFRMWQNHHAKDSQEDRRRENRDSLSRKAPKLASGIGWTGGDSLLNHHVVKENKK